MEQLVGAVDSVHASGPVLPRSRAPLVAVVFDLAGLDHPGLHPARDVAQLEAVLAGLGRAAAVITISQATADVLRARGVPDRSLHAIPLGATELPEPDDPGWTQPYILAVGAPVPRKAFALLLRALPHLDEQIGLVIVGPPGSEDRRLDLLADQLQLKDRYHRAGAVDDARLAGWYAGASVVVAPSVDEGFGLPLIEAQRAGVPVVATDIAAHREVTAGSATLVPVGSLNELTEAIAAAITGGPGMASTLQRARENAARYTWAACAEATLAVHRAVTG